MQRLVIILLLWSLFAQGYSKCEEGWFEYNNEKCYKILNDFVTEVDAVTICTNESSVSETPKLLEILTATEQAFVSSLIFEESQIFDSVWLGATRHNTTSFKWSDGTSLVYSNWLEGTPSNDSANGCSQLSSGISKQGAMAEAGLWTDVPCSKRNLVVCQTPSTLTLKQLQDVVYEMRNNPVPIGFIYTEYPSKPNPQSIWPSLVWKNVTSEYAGIFFRAEGGDSSAFGVSQAGSAPRLISVQYLDTADGFATIVTVPSGAISAILKSGNHDPYYISHTDGIRFENSGGEVRPINKAVRMWERVG